MDQIQFTPAGNWTANMLASITFNDTLHFSVLRHVWNGMQGFHPLFILIPYASMPAEGGCIHIPSEHAGPPCSGQRLVACPLHGHAQARSPGASPNRSSSWVFSNVRRRGGEKPFWFANRTWENTWKILYLLCRKESRCKFEMTSNVQKFRGVWPPSNFLSWFLERDGKIGKRVVRPEDAKVKEKRLRYKTMLCHSQNLSTHFSEGCVASSIPKM